MRIAHASDLHGNIKLLGNVEAPDLWIISGDFFPNYGRGPLTDRRIDPNHEIGFQYDWWERKSERIMGLLRNAPVIWIGGNHDFISLIPLLSQWNYGAEIHDLGHGPVTFGGKVFAGFSEIPYINGEWNGEEHSFEDIVQRTMECDPDILVTHAPAAGLLDTSSYGHVGISELTTQLTYAPHRITHHFFGHVHDSGGKKLEEMGILFVNSAETIQVVNL